MRALDKGFVEANPLLRGLDPAPFVAVKVVGTAGAVVLTRHVFRRNRVAGILLLAALDSVYSFAVVRNLKVTGAHAAR